MYANQYLNGGKASYGVSDYTNTETVTEPPSKQPTRTVTPEQHARIVNQFKSNQKDCKVPDEEESQVLDMNDLC
jgi:hypothetical protein